MNKAKFINKVKSSLGDVPKDQLDEILADYEEYFSDGLASGRTEEEIAKGLGDPAKIAKELRAEIRIQQWQKKKSVGNLGRVVLGLAALGSLNLFLAIPMLLMMILLTASYGVSVLLILVGLAASASYLPGLGGLMQIDNDKTPLHFVEEKNGRKIEITRESGHGMNIHIESSEGTKDIQTDDADDDDDEPGTVVDSNNGMMHMVLDDLHGFTLPQVRAVSAVGGLFGGAFWLLVNLWVTRIMIRGFVKYARLNYSILRGE
ncbi:HAAS signaling domain-containing protein [Telmatospirillum sp.]|uniref:DUF1700 domain-containing protein n=1 Tax=Telmatospirillum sp. TaxID=2079197 RepID=UPI00284CFDBF|nr:DUF1700 domain-containing protein [Telmatospirillum sp.]MDR3439771.1 DUF1700 domain-containing protein [Telmatospirillum sp.]